MACTIIGFFVLFITIVQAISEDVPSAPGIEETERLAREVNEFGYKLMLRIMKDDPYKNIVISPTGIAGLLAMTLLGSAGSTYDEIAQALGFSQDILQNRKNHETFGDLLRGLNNNSMEAQSINVSDNNINSSISEDIANVTSDVTEDVPMGTLYADAIVVDELTRIRDVYGEYLDRVYHGEALSTSFRDIVKSQQLINDWVKNQTHGKINDFLKEPLPVTTKVVLLSALYFSSQWARPFVPEYTKKMAFRKPSGDVMADLMLNLGDFNYIYKLQPGAHMIAFPYNDSVSTMYIIKPLLNKVTLETVLEALNYTTIDSMINNMTSQQCIVRFPKMDLSSKFNLKDPLTKLGINSMFSGDANFALMVDNKPILNSTVDDGELVSRIYTGDEESNKLKSIVNSLPNPGIYVDSVLHDVKMTVNEFGTVAVAASSGVLSRTAKMFYANSPFYMFIRNEKSKLVTFSAVIYDPTES